MRRTLLPKRLKLPWTPLILSAMVGVFAFIAWGVGPETALFLYAALCGMGLLLYTAYRHPLATVILAFVAGALLDINAWVSFRAQVSGIELRFFDPILLGMLMAIGLKLFLGDARLGKILTRSMPVLGLLLLWFIYTAVRSIPTYGFVSAFGEFRTYHQYFVIALYIATFFRTRQAQWQLFKLLLISSLVLVAWGFYSIQFRSGVSFSNLGPRARFISSYTNIALLWGVVGLYVADRQRLINLKGHVFYGLVLSYGLLTLFNNHRSVWMATGASLVLLVLLRRLSARRQLQVGIGIFIIVIGLSAAPNSFNEEITGFIQERSSAFTDTEDDATASWRLLLWQQAIDGIRQHPVQGVGLGQNFQFSDEIGQLITTSPHNEYLTLAYHGGLTGLALYLVFIASVLLKLRSRLIKPSLPKERAIYFTTLMVVAVMSLYYVAYTSEKDFMTWFYVGLGLAALANKPVELANPKGIV